jgi:hypothetical protein
MSYAKVSIKRLTLYESIEQAMDHKIVQKSTTCPKVTKFTDIFWKLAANLQKV